MRHPYTAMFASVVDITHRRKLHLARDSHQMYPNFKWMKGHKQRANVGRIVPDAVADLGIDLTHIGSEYHAVDSQINVSRPVKASWDWISKQYASNLRTTQRWVEMIDKNNPDSFSDRQVENVSKSVSVRFEGMVLLPVFLLDGYRIRHGDRSSIPSLELLSLVPLRSAFVFIHKYISNILTTCPLTSAASINNLSFSKRSFHRCYF